MLSARTTAHFCPGFSRLAAWTATDMAEPDGVADGVPRVIDDVGAVLKKKRHNARVAVP